MENTEIWIVTEKLAKDGEKPSKKHVWKMQK